MNELLKNQIALALILFAIIVVGAYITMGKDAGDVIVQVITATGALVTGGAIGYSMGKRATDVPSTTESKKEADHDEKKQKGI